MKPLMLTAYPLDRSFPRGYVLPRDTRVTFRAAERMAKAKRFTDAELAAEMFSAVFHEAECEVRGLRLEAMESNHPGINGWVDHNLEFGRQADIITRFATLPHYDEVTE